MDIKAYIQSGILEQYVLGGLDQKEQREVENYAQQYPEIKEELGQIEAALESYAQLASKTPPPGVLDDILKKVDTSDQTASVGSTAKSSPVLGGASAAQGFSWTRFFAIAMSIKFLLALGGFIYLFFRNQALHDQLEQQRVEQEASQSVCDSISTQVFALQNEVLFLKDLNTRPIVLNSTGIIPNAGAAVYLNPDSRRVYLSKLNLPAPPTNKQYQLWAIVEGTPVSMGVFDIPNNSNLFIEVPFVANASAFAISLEDTGGSIQPTADQIYALGTV